MSREIGSPRLQTKKDLIVARRADKKLHDTVGFVGFRAQATAVGLLQLSAELKRAGVIDDEAIGRITDAIAKRSFYLAPSLSIMKSSTPTSEGVWIAYFPAKSRLVAVP